MMEKLEKGLDVQQALDEASEHLLCILPEFEDCFPNSYSKQRFYRPIENKEWTNGFWTGELWLAYEHTGREQFRKVALRQVDSFDNRIRNRICVEHHDMGFLYIPSCVAAWKLTGEGKARDAAMLAADQLKSRFQEHGSFIQAWGAMGLSENYRLIIDCLMNVPLLYWAAEESGRVDYREIADRHIATTLHTVIREDGSTWHTYYFDPETGKPDHGETSQGYANDSAWARGQAWGIYGTALAYRYTGNPECMTAFQKVATYFADHLPADGIPFWDLCFSAADEEPWDTSAAAIAICGLLEMLPFLSNEEQGKYKNMVNRMMNALYQKAAVKDATQSNGLLLHGTYAKSSPLNHCEERGVDECNAWGDYFYMEALTRLKGNWHPYW